MAKLAVKISLATRIAVVLPISIPSEGKSHAPASAFLLVDPAIPESTSGGQN